MSFARLPDPDTPLGHAVMGVVLSAVLLSGLAWPQAATASERPVYRCPGPPVLYTDALTPQEARERDCRTIEGAPVTVVQTPRPRAPAVSPSSPAGEVPATARNPEARVDPAAQRARDADARRILGEELRREEAALAALQREFNNGQPERRGDERNYQKYLDRVADMKAGISRKEADIAALKRELAKMAP